MSASLAFWIISFLLIVVLPFAVWAAYRGLNWRAWGRPVDPQGHQFGRALEKSPIKRRYGPSAEYRARSFPDDLWVRRS